MELFGAISGFAGLILADSLIIKVMCFMVTLVCWSIHKRNNTKSS